MARKKKDTTEALAPDTTARGDRTRRHIKKVIAKLVNKKDLADITLADICKGAKLTTGAVYFHFGSRDEAIEEMVIDEVKALYAAQVTDPSEGFEDTLRRIIDCNTEHNLRNKQMPRVIATSIFTRPKVYDAWLAAREPVVARLQELIAAERESRSLPGEDAAYLAHFILNSIEDLAIDVFQWSNPTLAPFASDPVGWRERQTAMWAWAILAPFADAAKPAALPRTPPKRARKSVAEPR